MKTIKTNLTPKQQKEIHKLFKQSTEHYHTIEVLSSKMNDSKQAMWEIIIKANPELDGKNCSYNSITREVLIKE